MCCGGNPFFQGVLDQKTSLEDMLAMYQTNSKDSFTNL